MGCCICVDTGNNYNRPHQGHENAVNNYGEEAPDEAPPEEEGGDEAPPEEAVEMYGAAEPKLDDFNKRDDFDEGQGVYAFDNLTSSSGEASEWSDSAASSESDHLIQAFSFEKDGFKSIPFWRKSAKDRDSSQLVTIVTQCSLDRMKQLHNMCLTWEGVISVSVHVPSTRVQSQALRELDALFARVESDACGSYKCVLDIHLLCERVESSSQSVWYPINKLRNLALNNCATKFAFLLDVDFVPSRELQAHINKAVNGRLHADKKLALVVPAFEFDRNINTLQIDDYPLSRGRLAEAFDAEDGRVSAFHLKHFKAGHKATNYEKWMECAKMDSSGTYAVDYEMYYEPYVVVRCDEELRRYDERFDGYGFNKIVHIAGLSIVDKFKFCVLKDGFVVAPTHKKSVDYMKTYRTRNVENATERRKHISKLATTAFDEMNAAAAKNKTTVFGWSLW